MIDIHTYETIEKAFAWEKVFSQTNTYYRDENGILGRAGVVVRAREIGGKRVLQVKAHKNSGGSVQISEESEFPLAEVQETIPAEEARKYTGTDIGTLHRMGSLTTLRHSLMWDKDTEICLDKSDYFKITDYEIEVEYTSAAVADELLGKLAGFGVVFGDGISGKFTRFLREFNNIK